MRRLSQLIFLLLIFSLTFKFTTFIDQEVQRYLERSEVSQQFEQSKASLIYFQTSEPWLEFNISERPAYLRLLSNAVLPSSYAQAKQIWHYAIQYQLINNNNQVIEDRVYHHRSQIGWVKNKLNQAIYSRRFFNNENKTPTSTGEIIIANNRQQIISKIKVRVISADKEISRLGFRLYARQSIPDSKLQYAWQGLSESEKSHLARTNIYSADLLREQERYDLLKYRWLPVGPSGIDGREYDLDKIYVFQDEMIDEIEDEQILPQVSAHLNYRKIYRLPEQGGLVNLRLEKMNHTQTGTENKQLQTIVNWYGKGLGKYKSFTLKPGQAENWEQLLDSGMLEVIVNRPVTIKASITVARDSVELLNQESLLRSYRVNPTNRLNFKVEHIGHNATPIRIDLRSRISGQSFSKQIFHNKILKYYFFDQDNRPIGEGSIAMQEIPSFYDRLLKSPDGDLLSESTRTFLNVPANVATIQFHSDNELFINLYNRPPDFPYYIHVPENYSHSLSKQEQVPIWFALKPSNYLSMQNEKDFQLTLIQPKPRKDNINIYRESYEWQDYKPDNRWSARYLLNHRNEDIPIKREALGEIYEYLESQKVHTLNFSGIAGEEFISPRIIYIKDNAKATNITILYNNKPLLTTKVFGSNGLIQLPTIKTGNAKFQIKTSAGINFYSNHVLSKRNNKRFIRRLSNRLGKRTLMFSYEKNKPQVVLSALFQTHYGNSERSRILLSIEPVKRQKQSHFYTLEKRIFDIRPNNQEKIKVLNTDKDYVGAGQRIYIPLGEDLKQGQYKISVTKLDGPEGYFSLYQFSIGKDNSIRFFKSLKGE